MKHFGSLTADVDMPMAARSSLLGDHPQHPGQQGSMGQQHMDMHMGGSRGPPFMEGRGKWGSSLLQGLPEYSLE